MVDLRRSGFVIIILIRNYQMRACEVSVLYGQSLNIKPPGLKGFASKPGGELFFTLNYRALVNILKKP